MRLWQIEDSIRKLCLGIDAEAEERILGDALAALECTHVSVLGCGLSAIRIMRRGLPVRLACAASIIAIAYVGVEYLAGYLEGCSDTTALTIELASNGIVKFFGS